MIYYSIDYRDKTYKQHETKADRNYILRSFEIWSIKYGRKNGQVCPLVIFFEDEVSSRLLNSYAEK